MNEWPIKRNPGARGGAGASEGSQLGSWIPRSLLPPAVLMQAQRSPIHGESVHHTLQCVDGEWWIIHWNVVLKRARRAGAAAGAAYCSFKDMPGKKDTLGAL